MAINDPHKEECEYVGYEPPHIAERYEHARLPDEEQNHVVYDKENGKAWIQSNICVDTEDNA